MGDVVRFPRHARASAGSIGYKSGRNSKRGTPVAVSIGNTNSAGTPRLERISQYQTCDCVVPILSAKGFWPPASSQARRSASVDMRTQYPDLGENQPKNLWNTTYRKFGIVPRMKLVDKKGFGRRLTERLKEFGTNPNEFGQEIGIGQSVMQRLCAGETANTKYIKYIAEKLYTTDRWLLHEEEPKDVFPQDLREQVMRHVMDASGPELVRMLKIVVAQAENRKIRYR